MREQEQSASRQLLQQSTFQPCGVNLFSVVSARERRRFWATLPSKTFQAAIAADAIIGTALTRLGLPGLSPLPWWQTLTVFVYAMVACLILNDSLKVAMIKWRIPAAAA